MKKNIREDELSGPVYRMKYSTFDEKGTCLGTQQSTYNAQGDLIKWETWLSDGQPEKILLYTFDNNGVLREETLSLASGKPVYHNNYYENGALRESISYYESGTWKTLYDENGEVLQELENDKPVSLETTDPYNEQWDTTTTVAEDGSKTEKVYYSAYGDLMDITVRAYNPRQQLLEETVYKGTVALGQGTADSVKTFRYDEHGQLTEQISRRTWSDGTPAQTIFRYHHQYDERHNWIEKTEIMNNHVTGFQDKIQFIRRREIEYHQ